jgi:DNA mismatch repair protein MutS2
MQNLMPMTNEHSLELLDFPRIRERVSEYCLSEEGKTLMRGTLPCIETESVRNLKKDVKTIETYLGSHELPSLSFPEMEAVIKVLSKEGAVFDLEMLYAAGLWAKNYDSFIGFFSRIPGLDTRSLNSSTTRPFGNQKTDDPGDEEWARRDLRTILENSPRLGGVTKTVFEIVDASGAMLDLPPIRKAREAIGKVTRDIARISNSYSKNPDLRSALQTEEPTVRDGRTVLALKANFRSRVKGIVHEVSTTGQTIFVEPAELVERNNALIQLEARLHAEILKILKIATSDIRNRLSDILVARRILADLDVRLARAVQSKREDLVQAGECDRGFQLWQARHPLLGKKAVPIDVNLPEETRVLIVTGPNTGGKTVTLKTIGLFALMNQYGLSLPSGSETKFSIFDEVLADIGDEQSIDQSLSTFSGHMKVMAGIVRDATASSLVLLDELGAGTDPEEGCAIAMGLLDHFLGKDSLTIATTHHGILKNYGYTRQGCLNASMEFDSAHLAPTYRIVMGIPGQSRALEIAAQTGLPAKVTEAARRYLAEERADIGELIESLTEKHREIDLVERDRRRRLRKAMDVQRKLDLESLKLRQQEIELRRDGVSALRRLLSESRKTLENLVREFREAQIELMESKDHAALTGNVENISLRGKIDGEKTKEVKAFLSDLAKAVETQEAALDALEDATKRDRIAIEKRAESQLSENSDGTEWIFDESNEIIDTNERLADERPFMKGEMVAYGPLGKSALILREAGKSKYLVEIGSIRLTVHEEELSHLASNIQKAAPVTQYQVELSPQSGEGSREAKLEIDLRGFRLGEALMAMEKQIDSASLAGMSFFSIIHGTGEGILGKGIHEYLRNNPSVETYHFANPENGGYGKTIVRLK